MDTRALLDHARREIDGANETVRLKRSTFRERLRLYVDQKKDRDKVADNTIYASMQLYLAVLASDDVSVRFASRSGMDDARTEYLSALARSDMEDMRLRELNYQKDWDRLFFGVGIRVKTGWDPVKKSPRWVVKDPLSWIPDPLGNHVDRFRFHYFEEEMVLSAMTSERGFDPDAVEELKKSRQETGADGCEVLIGVYNGYTWHDGASYSVTLDDRREHLLRVVRVDADESGCVEDLVNVSYFSPLRGDPYGVSLVDLVEDKQRANSILMNLRLIDAKFSTFGQYNLFDSRAVDREDLSVPSLATKWISFDSSLGVPITQAIYPVPRERIAQDSYLVSQEIARRIQIETGIDNRTLGIEGETATTYGESQQLQTNANVRLGLNIEIAHWGEREFWREWYRSYYRYFAPGETKTIRVDTGFGSKLVTLAREDIVSEREPEIAVESSRVAAARLAEQKRAFADKLPLVLQNARSPITRNYAIRKACRLDGFSREEAMLLVPPTPDELFAADLAQSLGRDTLPDGLAENLAGRDLVNVLMLLSCVHETRAKASVVALLRTMIQESDARATLDRRVERFRQTPKISAGAEIARETLANLKNPPRQAF